MKQPILATALIAAPVLAGPVASVHVSPPAPHVMVEPVITPHIVEEPVITPHVPVIIPHTYQPADPLPATAQDDNATSSDDNGVPFIDDGNTQGVDFSNMTDADIDNTFAEPDNTATATVTENRAEMRHETVLVVLALAALCAIGAIFFVRRRP